MIAFRRGLVAALVISFSVITPALAASGWQPLAPVPDPDGPGFRTGRTEGACVASIGNKIYMAYGFDSADTQFLRIYDIASDTWSFGPLAPAPVASEGYRGVAHGGKLYCVGKRPVGTPDVRSFDPSSGTWTVLTSMSDDRAGTTAEVFGNAVYVFGGRKAAAPCSGPAVAPGGGFTTVLRYDIDTDTWSNAGNLAVNRSDATAARVGSEIFIFGGCDGANFDSVEVYDPITQTSSLLAATLPSARSNAAAATVGNDIHVTGGSNSQFPAGTNHVIFDTTTGTFSVGTPMPTHCPPGAPRGEHELVAHGARIYAVAGACPFFGTSINNLDVLKAN